MSDLAQRIAAFLDGSPHAVVGASNDRSKFGNIVLRAYAAAGRLAFPVNRTGGEVEGRPAYATLSDLPVPVHGVSIVTPPPITEKIVEEAGRLGIRHLWMQPGAQNTAAVARAIELGISVVGGDACILHAL